jgi:hypothetical protein
MRQRRSCERPQLDNYNNSRLPTAHTVAARASRVCDSVTCDLCDVCQVFSAWWSHTHNRQDCRVHAAAACRLPFAHVNDEKHKFKLQSGPESPAAPARVTSRTESDPGGPCGPTVRYGTGRGHRPAAQGCQAAKPRHMICMYVHH